METRLLTMAAQPTAKATMHLSNYHFSAECFVKTNSDFPPTRRSVLRARASCPHSQAFRAQANKLRNTRVTGCRVLSGLGRRSQEPSGRARPKHTLLGRLVWGMETWYGNKVWKHISDTWGRVCTQGMETDGNHVWKLSMETRYVNEETRQRR